MTFCPRLTNILHLECPTGLGGDMLLAGLLDLGNAPHSNLGLDLAEMESALRAAGLDFRLDCRKAKHRGLAGNLLEVTSSAVQPQRRLSDIQAILARLPLTEGVRGRSLAAFERLACVEAKVHGCDLEAVHFHEVGAVDTIVDVVGTFWALEKLEIGRVTASSLPWFSGRIDCAHGVLPLPAPAVIELLRGKPVFPTHYEAELITPTGALLLDQIVDEFGYGPNGQLMAHGLGLGHIELPDQPNILRCYLLRTQDQAKSQDIEQVETVAVLETNIDHLTGEELGACFDALLQAGALDVLFVPGVMKKNRPGGMMQVLCGPEDLSQVQRAVFAQTMTLGLRRQMVQRVTLERTQGRRETPLGSLSVKETTMNGKTYARPEFEALQDLARRTGRSVTQLRYLLHED